ncbi:hypothetical protein ACFL21_01700 [Patescibacteria group bacterium]
MSLKDLKDLRGLPGMENDQVFVVEKSVDFKNGLDEELLRESEDEIKQIGSELYLETNDIDYINDSNKIPEDKRNHILFLAGFVFSEAQKEKMAAVINNPLSVANILSEDPSVIVRIAVAKNSSSESILRKMSYDLSFYVRLELAGNRNTPTDVLRRLIIEGIRFVWQIAEHPKAADPVLLEIIMQDAHARERLAANPSVPEIIYRDLLKDKRDAIRIKLARNISVPEDMVQDLRKDEDSRVSILAVSNLRKRSQNESVSV